MPLYESLGIMKLNDINKYLIARFMYKYCSGMVPWLFSSYFVRNYYVSSYDLRSSNCFCLPIVTSDLGKNGVRYRGPVLFNKRLTEGFNHTVFEAVFVKQLKLSIKICILWYWKYQISMEILERKIRKKHCSFNYYICIWFFSLYHIMVLQ